MSVKGKKAVRPGYKLTDVGVIPEEWDVKKMMEISTVKGGKRLPKGWSVLERPNSHPYIRVADMRMGWVDLSDLHYVPNEVLGSIENYRIFPADIFISVAWTLWLIGKIPAELSGANLTENANRITNIACHQDYLIYVLSSDRIQGIIDSVRTVGAQPKLALGQIENFQIQIPNGAEEQSAIAQVLSDTDALIASLDALIEKKQAIKQGAMQELLTAKRRLPGFEGDWESDALGSRGDCIRWVSYDPNSDLLSVEDSASVRLLRSNNVQESRLDFSEVQIVRRNVVKDAQEMRIGDILICMANWSKDLVWKSARFNVSDWFKYTFGAFMGCFRPYFGKSDPWFIFYLTKTHRYSNFIWNLLAGSSINNLGPTQLESFTFDFPSLPEQSAIAQVLSDMDAEISALEAKRDKYKAIKQGMMQELLTGNIRLVWAK